MSDNEANQLDGRAAALAGEAHEVVREVADGKAAAGAQVSAEAMIEAAQQLQTAADKLRTERENKSANEAAADLAARLMADNQAKQPDKPQRKSILQRAAEAIGSGETRFTANLDIPGAARFMNAARNGLTAMEVQRAAEFGPDAVRALSIGTDTAGGHLVPDTFETAIYQALQSISGLRAAGARVITTPGGEPYILPTATSPTITGVANATAEATAATDTDPTFAQITLNAQEYVGQMRSSRILLTDTPTNLEALVADEIGKVVAIKMEREFTAGAGTTTSAKGITHSVPAAQQSAVALSTATGAPTYKELTDALGDLDPLYTSGPDNVLMMNSKVFWSLVGITDNTGQPVHQPRTIERPFNSVLGIPVVFNNFMDEYAASKNIIVAGNLRRAYAIRDAGPFEFNVSTEAAFENRQIIWQGVQRSDGGIIDTAAYRVLRTAAS